MRMDTASKYLAGVALASAAFTAAYAQTPDAAIKQNLLQRQQQQDELSLKIQQSQQLLQPQLNASQRNRLSELYLQQQVDQQEQQSRQLQSQIELEQSSRPLGAEGQRLRLEIQLRQFDRDRDAQLLQQDAQRKSREAAPE
jgi:hypothetical protein